MLFAFTSGMYAYDRVSDLGDLLPCLLLDVLLTQDRDCRLRLVRPACCRSTTSRAATPSSDTPGSPRWDSPFAWGEVLDGCTGPEIIALLSRDVLDSITTLFEERDLTLDRLLNDATPVNEATSGKVSFACARKLTYSSNFCPCHSSLTSRTPQPSREHVGYGPARPREHRLER